MKPGPLSRDRHALYEASVQGVESDLDFFERVYRAIRGRGFRDFREDFCGTAQMACAWVMRGGERRAWGVDLDPEPLAWARRHHLPAMRDAARRVTLMRRDVRSVTRPRVDVICAMNFSYWVFHRRADLVRYFSRVRRSLRPGGLFFANAFGGTEAMAALTERRRIAASNAPDGTLVPAFGYEWEHASFNPIDHRIVCHIHFTFRGGERMRRAFTYDWRLWTLPEIGDALAEAGFARHHVYLEGWDEKAGTGDGVYRRRVHFENQEGWLAVVVGVT